MSLLLRRPDLMTPPWLTDPDARDFIRRVEAADGAPLENGVRLAYRNFVVGCKADGTYSAIKACCIMAGARTLSGALVPLVGPAPTSFNFVSGDYNRKTGLVGDGSTKYLDSNRAGNADPFNNCHICVYKTNTNTAGNFLIGVANSGSKQLQSLTTVGFYVSNRAAIVGVNGIGAGFMGASNTSAALSARALGSVASSSTASSDANETGDIFVFTRNIGGVNSGATSARLAFYSIGESLNLTLLDARVTALINAIGGAIP